MMKDKTKAQLLKENKTLRKDLAKRNEEIIKLIHDSQSFEAQASRFNDIAMDRKKSLDERKASLTALSHALRACHAHAEGINEAAIKQASGYTEENQFSSQPIITVEPGEVDFKACFMEIIGFIRGIYEANSYDR
jgi:hypothetical protein